MPGLRLKCMILAFSGSKAIASLVPDASMAAIVSFAQAVVSSNDVPTKSMAVSSTGNAGESAMLGTVRSLRYLSRFIYLTMG